MNDFTVPEDTRIAQATAAQPWLSAFVSANAGSGKTHVLAQRVIRLLLGGADPSRILCLTYTRAAAANMAGRVFRNLARWATLPQEKLAQEIAELEGETPTPERIAFARRLFARALETPGGLKIQTIHAFCEAVLQQFPLEANIAGHFEMLDSQMEEALLAEARREMIANATTGGSALASAFATVLELGGESGLEALLAEIVAHRDALRRFIVEIGDGGPEFSPLFAEFSFAADDTPAVLADGIWPDSYFTTTVSAAIGERAVLAGKTTAQAFAVGFAKAASLSDPLERLDCLRGLFLTGKPGSWSTKSTRNLMAKGVGEFFPEFVDEFCRFAGAISQTCDRIALLSMLQATRAALVIADWLIARYERLKSARGFLDFNDLIVRTVALLSRRDAGAWVHYKLDKGIDHVLLDEAQDTSPDQWAVVKALTDEFFAGHGAREATRTIFAVGDEKQSIYSFQGAEPESFALGNQFFRERVTRAQGKFEHVRLSRSFRSTWDVLSAVDQVFASEENRAGLTLDPEPIEHKAIRDDAPGQVEIWPSLSPTEVEEPDDWSAAVDHASAPSVQLARQIAATIDHWIRSGERIGEKARLLVPGDVMVLVRKRDRFIHALSRELKERGIPVAGADRLLLTGHIAVQDLLAIARICLQPDDDLSLAALLKSPVFGFDEDELFTLATGRPSGSSLLSALRAASDRGGKAASAWQALSLWRAEAGFVSPFAFFSSILARDGLQRNFIARLGPEAGDIVDEFLNFCLAAEKTGVTGLEALVALLDGGGPQVKREMDQTRGEVRIMTVHAAKGLEAPVVFLVDGGAAPFSASHLPRLMPFDAPQHGWRSKGFLWRASAETSNSFATGLQKQAEQRAQEEYRRLLYVGMTRAEDRLIVCGYHGVRGRRDGTWHAMVEAALGEAPETTEELHPATGQKVLRYAVTPYTPRIPQDEPTPQEKARFAPPPSVLFEPLPPAPALPRPLSPSAAGVTVEPQPPSPEISSPVLDVDDAAPSLALGRGIAAHRLLQMLPAIEPARREQAALRYLRHAGAAWSTGEREQLWSSISQLLDDPAFAPIFAPGSRAEVAVMGTIKLGGSDRAVSGKIDRLAVTDAAVLVVDFKTGRPVPAGPEAIPTAHLAQMAVYAALVAPLYPDRQIHAALVYTDGPSLVKLDGDRLADALARLAMT